MKQFAPLLCCLLLVGCMDPLFNLPEKSTGKTKVKPSKPVAETVFTVLAENVKADLTYYATTDDLRRTVSRLLATGRITQAQADKVTDIVGKTRRPITDKDLEAIRGL